MRNFRTQLTLVKVLLSGSLISSEAMLWVHIQQLHGTSGGLGILSLGLVLLLAMACGAYLSGHFRQNVPLGLLLAGYLLAMISTTLPLWALPVTTDGNFSSGTIWWLPLCSLIPPGIFIGLTLTAHSPSAQKPDLALPKVPWFFWGAGLGIGTEWLLITMDGLRMASLAGPILLALLLLLDGIWFSFSESTHAGVDNKVVEPGRLTSIRLFLSMLVVSISLTLLVQSGIWYISHSHGLAVSLVPACLLIFLLALGFGAHTWNRHLTGRWSNGMDGFQALILLMAFAAQYSIFCLKHVDAISEASGILVGLNRYREVILQGVISGVCLFPSALIGGWLISWIFQEFRATHRGDALIWSGLFLGSGLALTLSSWLVIPLIGFSWLVAGIPQAFLTLVPRVTRTWVVAAISVSGFSAIFLYTSISKGQLADLPPPVSAVESISSLHSFFTSTDSGHSERIHLPGTNSRSMRFLSREARDFLLPILWHAEPHSALLVGDELGAGADLLARLPTMRHIATVLDDGVAKALSPLSEIFNRGSLISDADQPVVSILPSPWSQGANQPRYDLFIVRVHSVEDMRGAGLMSQGSLRQLHQSLKPGGWGAIWIPVSSMDSRTIDRFISALVTEFPRIHCFLSGPPGFVDYSLGFLVSDEGSRVPDLAELSRRLGRMLADWDAVGMPDLPTVIDLSHGYLGNKKWLAQRIPPGDSQAPDDMSAWLPFHMPFSKPRALSSQLAWIREGWIHEFLEHEGYFHPGPPYSTLFVEWDNRRTSWFLYLSALRYFNSSDLYNALQSALSAIVADDGFEAPVQLLKALKNRQPSIPPGMMAIIEEALLDQ